MGWGGVDGSVEVGVGGMGRNDPERRSLGLAPHGGLGTACMDGERGGKGKGEACFA